MMAIDPILLGHLIEQAVWFGFAALGFAILFNVPPRTLPVIFLLAALGGVTKLLIIDWGGGLVLASFGGATLIGILSIQAAHNKHSPHIVFSIPAVIPMVPGVFAYRMMIGLVKLVGQNPSDNYANILAETVKSGLNVAFISMSLVIGAGVPFLITRKNSAKLIFFNKNLFFQNKK